MTADVFDRIYREGLWNGVESRSGPGSGTAATERVAHELAELVTMLGIRSVLDVGCGDGFWMPDLPRYVGIDVSAEAITRARRNHPERDYRLARLRDLAEPRMFDLVIARDAIQHCSFADGLDLLAAIRETGSHWLLASTYRGGENVDIATGACYSPDLEAAPFLLGSPELVIFDGYTYHDSGAVRDARKFLGLWPIGVLP